MGLVTVSSQYRIVIPKESRKRMGILPGQTLAVFQSGDRLVLVPINGIPEIRGIARGISTTVKRDIDRF